CRTGEAKLTKGFNLAARYIVHTVGPKYKSKYRTAAESSLYSCYRNTLQLAAEQSMASVGFCVVTTTKRGYPLEDATHIAFRTVRRFLEHHGNSLEAVVFAVSDTEEPVFRKLLPLYFPRSEEEERASLPLIPADIGNSKGEPVVPERQIRIAEKPGTLEDDSEEESLDSDLGQVGTHAFARMEGDVDKQRKQILQGQMSDVALQKQHQRNYNRWLCRARAEDLSDIAALKALYQTGVDLCGRTVMILVGRNIPVTLIDIEKALLYFIHVMDHITVKEYVMVYFHTLTGEHNHLDSEFLKNLYDIVDVKFKKNLKAFYFVHPTFRSKVSTWFLTTFSVSGLKDKVRYLDTLQQLFTCIQPEQIDIPPFVLDYDARSVTGDRFDPPVTNDTFSVRKVETFRFTVWSELLTSCRLFVGKLSFSAKRTELAACGRRSGLSLSPQTIRGSGFWIMPYTKTAFCSNSPQYEVSCEASKRFPPRGRIRRLRSEYYQTF
ncbi:hypothetical protein KUCAC02_010571, partial [Chaenocephalus aceratus]